MRARANTSPPVLGKLRDACGFCSLHELCWPMGLEATDLERLQSMVRHAGPFPVGSYLFRTGDQFTAIYAVRSGCIKSYSVDAGGHELVHGFHLRGELLGFDAVYPEQHHCNALILEPCSVCVIPYHDIDRLSADFHSLHSQILRLISREFARQLMYGEGFGATQRIAAFLVNICSRLHQSGSAEYEFRLPMSREDIASYLAISPETLSRLLSKLRRQRLIVVNRRHVRLVDPERLKLLAEGLD